jgi:site-specific DNA recombinase
VISYDNAKWSPRRAEPGAWLLRGLVKCGPCGVATSCHKMRGRNGTWHRCYYCHDPLRAGGQDRRCPERNIRADALDEFVLGQIRAALLDPALLLAGEQASAVHARPPTTSCSPPSCPAWTAGSSLPAASTTGWSTSTRPA